MNYRSVGKELAEDLNVLSPSPWNYNVVLDAVSQRCFHKITEGTFTAAQKITEEARKEKTCSGVQKTERPLAVYIMINKNDTPPQTLPRKH